MEMLKMNSPFSVTYERSMGMLPLMKQLWQDDFFDFPEDSREYFESNVHDLKQCIGW